MGDHGSGLQPVYIFLPSFPSFPDFLEYGNIGYYVFDDILKLGFSTANNVNLIVDQSGADNDLTQGTASANMTFIEHDTVTQFTSGKQPTLVDTGGGELAMEFGAAGELRGLNVDTSGDFVIEVLVDYTGDNPQPNSLISYDAGDVRGLSLVDNTRIRVWADSATNFTVNGFNIYGENTLVKFKKYGSLFSVLANGVEVITDISSFTFSNPFTTISNTTNNNYFVGNLKSYRQWNSADSSGTPDFELLPTVDSCNVRAGQQVSRWNATSHRAFKNRLLSDGSDDNYDGLPTQAGDFSYVFKCEFNVIAQTEYLLSDTGDSAWLLLSDNYLYLRDTTGANDIALTGHKVEAGDHVYIISREGDDLKYYVDSCLKQTVDVTGRTFTFSRVGATADSLQALNAEWGVWNRAFTQDDVNYFSYLRSDDTNAILLPQLTPGCSTPPTTYPVNSANPNGTTQSFYNTSYDMTGKFTNFGWSCWVKLVDAPGVGQTILRASSVSSDITLLYDWGTLDPSLADKIVVGWFGGSWEYISTSNFTLGQWTHLVVSKNGSNWKLYIDGTEEIDHTALAEPYTTGISVFGTEHRSLVQKLASPCSHYYVANQALDQTDVDNLYNNGTPYCLADLPTVTKNKMSNHWKLGTFNGSTEADAVVDQIGSVDFTNVGSTPFTGTGLSVECN
jgi:hypothetical protein